MAVTTGIWGGRSNVTGSSDFNWMIDMKFPAYIFKIDLPRVMTFFLYQYASQWVRTYYNTQDILIEEDGVKRNPSPCSAFSEEPIIPNQYLLG